MTKYQNYRHYKLPITINPLEYGKLILKIDNIYILSVTSKTIAIITNFNDFNEIKFFREGDLIFSYKDYKTNENEFIRILNNKKFTFKDKILKNIEIMILVMRLLNSTTFFKNWNNNDWLKWIKEKINYLLQNYKAELFILFELTLIFLFYIIFFVIYPVELESSMMIAAIKPKFYKKTFNSIYYSIVNQVFSIELLEGYFNKFWKRISPKLHEDAHVYILLKIQFTDGNIHTIGKLIRIDHNNYKTFIDEIMNYVEGMGDYYKQSPLTKLVFSYGFKKGTISEVFSKTEINLMNFKDMKFPISINPIDYGKIIWSNKSESGYIYTISDHLNRTIIFKESESVNEITYFKNGLEIISFKDNKFSENKFLRKIGTKSLFFENGDKSLELLELNTPFISKLKQDKSEVNNFVTLDIETYGESVLTPYLICFYDGIKTYSFYLTDYNSVEEMFTACFDALFIRKYRDHRIYIHNMSKFDIIFLLKYLVKQVVVDPVIHRGKIIQLNINYGKDLQYKISINDSYLILLASLEKLGNTFNVENRKLYFPHKFVQKDNLNYIGDVPNIEYFFKITENDYINYYKMFNDNWNLKNEVIKYCEIDCISLYQIILKFNNLIFKYFNKNIHNYPTLSSLAFGIFRSNFMVEENISVLRGNIEKDIREGYTGGSTEMYIPYGKNIKCLDVNSLYPSVMIDKDMPIRKATKFIGDITKTENNPFGFFKVKVNCPDNILHPILQIRYKTKYGIKTISPVGSWSMWIFSEEMYNAMKYGYTFEILEGYLFERGIIFKDYVEFLYNLRVQYEQTHPLNLIAKILLNSLYGRFGMSPITIKYEIISRKEFEQIDETSIIDFIELEEYVLIGLKTNDIEEEININVAISAAITSYARIFMSQFKNNPLINLFYTDTDSIYTDSELDINLISNKALGKLKLEYVVDEAIFLGPKSYCLKLNNGQTVTKIKGLKNTEDLTINDFKDLLVKDFYIDKSHKKWFRDLEAGKITIKEQLYRIKKLDSKREYIYINNILSKTKSIKLFE